MKLDGDLSKHI